MKTPSLEDLEREHQKLYEKLLPTITEYQNMAARCLELQIDIIKKRLRLEVCPEVHERNLVATLSAREKLATLRDLTERLQKENITIDQVIYDPRTFAFHLYSKAK